MYTINHEFDPKTIDIADQYVLEVTNESKFYKEYMSAVGLKTNISARETLSFGDFSVLFHTYKNKVNDEDRHKFRNLVQNMLWKHYAEQFCDLEFIVRMIKEHPIRVTGPTPNAQLKVEIDQHIEKAQQHFDKVENFMNTLSAYQDKASATVTLIHGKPVENWTEAELVARIRDARAAQASIKDLVDTSTRMKAKYEQYEADIKVYTEALDKLPEA